MIGEHALAAYRNRPALVRERVGDKIVVALPDGEKIRVREKDIEALHPGPVKSFNEIGEKLETGPDSPDASVKETWELLLADGGSAVSLRELAELAYGEDSPASAWAAFRLLADGLYFTGSVGSVRPRQREQVEADEKKRGEKLRADGERGAFLERLKNRRPFLAETSDGTPDDGRFVQDVEALACGRSAKSRTMRDLGLGDTPEEAHALLLESGFWTELVNPHPARHGVSLLPARHVPDPPPPEDRRDLTGLPAFAVDNRWSDDPDDAISLRTEDGRQVLYVHVADPAASIGADSPCEREARDRGATLYLPEGSHRMLAGEALPLFALGLAELSPALTFRVTLDAGGNIEDTEIFPSTVRVSRLTYGEADGLIEGAEGPGAVQLRELDLLAERSLSRRTAVGAVNIEMPETRISVDSGAVTVEPIVRHRSAVLVRECMLLAGEAAGIWAAQRGLPVPYVGQETGDLPKEVLPGLAGAYQLRRCMRPRTLSVKPALHSGLGLATYTQVTSPLRRYTDLLTHIQIRSLLRGGTPLPADEVAARMFAGEAASLTVARAERASRCHWLMVCLSGRKDSVWDAAALEKRGSRWATVIPGLALETQVPLRKEPAPNECVRLVLRSVSIPAGEAVFAAEE